MYSVEILLALWSFAFVSSATPGPNNLMLMASGMNYGFKKTIPHLFGIGLGFPAMIVLIGVGLMGVFSAIPYSFTVLRIVSALYLLFLAWKIANASPLKDDHDQSASKPFTFIQAALFQWVNPKAWAMALTAISVYSTGASPIIDVLVVACSFMAVGMITMSTWAILGVQLRRFFNDRKKQRTFNIACAVLLVATLYPMLQSLHPET